MKDNPFIKSRLERQFLDFHRQNPEVYDRLVELAVDAKSRGHKKLGIGMLFEIIRWERVYMKRPVDPHSEFKLNNNYRAYYARLIMKREPDLKGIFEIRRVQS